LRREEDTFLQERDMLKEVNEEMLVQFGMSKGALVNAASDVVL
jgi:hypothetical protein